MCVCVCVCACVRACVRACVSAFYSLVNFDFHFCVADPSHPSTFLVKNHHNTCNDVTHCSRSSSMYIMVSSG